MIRRRAAITGAAVVSLLGGCSGGAPVRTEPEPYVDDAYPVINTFLLALEARDEAAIEPTVAADPSSVAAELATHGGLPVDFFSLVYVIGEDDPAVGEFRAKIGPPDHDVTLSWWLDWRDGEWRIRLPPRQLADAQVL